MRADKNEVCHPGLCRGHRVLTYGSLSEGSLAPLQAFIPSLVDPWGGKGVTWVCGKGVTFPDHKVLCAP